MNHSLRVLLGKPQWALSNTGSMMYFGDLISCIKYMFQICKTTQVTFCEGIVIYSLIKLSDNWLKVKSILEESPPKKF